MVAWLKDFARAFLPPAAVIVGTALVCKAICLLDEALRR